MNTIEIENILNYNPYTKLYFRGVYSCNNIVNFNNFPYAIVVNTDRAGEQGKHWVAIFIFDKDHAEYFDSYGEEPNKYIVKYLEKFKNITKNKIKLQSIFDISCGPHVIYYIIQKCKGKTLKQIILDLSSPYSDSMVKLFVYNLLDLNV